MQKNSQHSHSKSGGSRGFSKNKPHRDGSRSNRDSGRPQRDASRPFRSNDRPQRDGNRPFRNTDRPQRNDRPERNASRPFRSNDRPQRDGGFHKDTKRRSFADKSGSFRTEQKSFRGNSGRRFGGGGGRRRPKSNIDISRFINKVSITEEAEVFVPANHFNDFHIEDSLKKAIAKREFILPTPIQDKIIPHILEGQDVVGLANTGTGKTGAFLIPLINKILKNKNEKAIVIAPTRELAQQIDEELKLFTRAMSIFSVVCVGGTNVGKQLRDLSRYHNFVIGTPGRIKDMVERGKIDLSKFSSIVLDEADRMLDMGFVPDMRFVMERMPKEKQILFFSATLPKEIESMVKNFLVNPVTISVKTRETSKNIEQDIVKVSRENKFDKLVEILQDPEFKKVLIFSRTKHGADRLSKDLVKLQFKVDAIHGDKRQSQRQKTLVRFKKGEVNILVATDVAARGLDIDDVTHVINYDIPETHDDYVHRIGRTGRGNKKGKALTFVE